MIQNVPGVGRVIPGQRINAPTKRNRTRPWTLAGQITFEDAEPFPNAVVLTATLASGQVRKYYYGVVSAAVGQLMVTSASNGMDAGNVAKKFTLGNRGGKAFAIPVRTQPVIVTAP